MKKIFLLGLLCTQSYMVNAQAALHDSLRNQLLYFEQNTKDETLKQIAQEARLLYASNKINDSLASKLVAVENLALQLIEENLFMNSMPFNRQTTFAYFEMLPLVLQYLPPQKENSYYACALNNLGVLNLYMGAPLPKAYTFLKQALDIRKKINGKEHLNYAASLINMADCFVRKINTEQAQKLIFEAIRIIKKAFSEGDVNYARALYILATTYKMKHQYDKAIKVFEEEIEVRKKILGEEKPRYALRLYVAAEMYGYMWQYKKAQDLYSKALAITKKTLGEESLQYAACLEGVASFYYSTSEYETAIPYYVESLAIKEKLFGKNYYDNALSLHNLSTTYQRMGQYEKALPLLQRASEISKKAFQEGAITVFNYAFGLNSLASLYQNLGQYEQALPLLKQAIEIAKNSKDEGWFYAQYISNLASLYVSMGKPEKALPYFQEALQIRKKIWGTSHPDYAISLNNLAKIYSTTGQCNKALPCLQQALSIRKKTLGEDHSEYATSLNNLGELYMKMRNYDTAMLLLKQSAAIRKKILGESHPEYVKSLNSLGLLQVAIGNSANAVELLTKANNIELKNILRTYTSLSEQEKINLVNEEFYQFSYLPSLLYTNKNIQPSVANQAYSNTLALKGIVLENQQQVLNNIRKSADSFVRQLYDQWRFNKTFLGKQCLLPIAQREPGLDSITEVTNQLEQQLSRHSSQFYNQWQTEITTAKDVIDKLKKGEAAVEFLRFKLYNKKWTDSILYVALIILPGDSIVKFIPLFEEKQLQHLLQPYTNGGAVAISKIYNVGNNVNNVSDSLYLLIWKPLEKYLSNISTVYYAPSGLLHRIAFQALPVNSSHLLIDSYQLNQVLSTRNIILPEQPISQPSLINVWANIQYDLPSNTLQNYSNAIVQRAINTTASAFNFYTSDTREWRGNLWSRLPGTKQEMDSIETVFTKTGINITTITDTLATEETFKALDGRSPPVLHIATHGFFLPSAKAAINNNSSNNSFTVQQNAMFRTGLVLARGNYAWKGEEFTTNSEDGILTAYEIAQMDLSKTQLVVLSACETALGDLQANEGVIGLQRAFKMAGVKQMIMSLWRVPDKETMDLMVMFYKSWLCGHTVRDALRLAQLKMKEKNPPYKWAAFVLIE